MALLDDLIDEIVSITGLTADEVTKKYTQEQLEYFLKESQCEHTDDVAPFAGSLEDLSCGDDKNEGSDLVKKLKDSGNFPNGLDEEARKVPSIPPSDDFSNADKCTAACDKVASSISEMMDIHQDHNIVLSKLRELRDNIKPIEIYYKRINQRFAEILNDFNPLIEYNKTLENRKRDLIDRKDSASSKSILDSINAELKQIDNSINENNSAITSKSLKYTPTNRPDNITYDNFTNKFTSNTSGTSSDNLINVEDLNELASKLKQYSEYLDIEINVSDDSTTFIGFKINLQNLNSVTVQKRKLDPDSGNILTYNDTIPIKNSPLLQSKTFFENIQGYKISNSNVKELSTGMLYTQYYNLLNDPINNFFSLQERGLTENSNLIDIQLRGTGGEKKKEVSKDYYIEKLDTLQSFYKDFVPTFEIRTKEVHDKVVNEGVRQLIGIIERIAVSDADLIINSSKSNLYGAKNVGELQKFINKYSDFQQKFIRIIDDLYSEINRIEILLNGTGKNEDSNKNIKTTLGFDVNRKTGLVPTAESVKKMLAKESSICFEDLPAADVCSECAKAQGSDPYGKGLYEGDYVEKLKQSARLPTPNQPSYWKKFTDQVNTHGLLPLPDKNPLALRYWPVGLTIPTPPKLIKIPLPMIWTFLSVIPTPGGITVFFLNTNGIFVAPVVFFMSSSGIKQHITTAKGPTPTFGHDPYA